MDWFIFAHNFSFKKLNDSTEFPPPKCRTFSLSFKNVFLVLLFRLLFLIESRQKSSFIKKDRIQGNFIISKLQFQGPITPLTKSISVFPLYQIKSLKDRGRRCEIFARVDHCNLFSLQFVLILLGLCPKVCVFFHQQTKKRTSWDLLHRFWRLFQIFRIFAMPNW